MTPINEIRREKQPDQPTVSGHIEHVVSSELHTQEVIMNFKQMRINLAVWGISAPESDEELGSRWDYYSRKLHRKMNPLAADG